MPEDDQELTEAAARGDRLAHDALLERYLPELRAFVRLRAGPLVRDRESSSDLVQSVCREVLENMERFRHPGEGAFKAWLFTTAMRKISDRAAHWRAEKREAMREVPVATNQGSEGDLAACYARFSSPSHGARLRDEMERIEAAFDELTPEQRDVVTLAHVVGLSRREIAERTGRSEGAVRVLLHRALARLSELMPEP